MLFEYAVEPKMMGSNWEIFRYLIGKFCFSGNIFPAVEMIHNGFVIYIIP